MKHIPVLKNEIVETFDYLKKFKGGVFVDGTVGTGGHSLAIAERCKIQETRNKFIGVDKDSEAIKLAKKNIEKVGLYDNFILIHDDFKNIKSIVNEKIPRLSACRQAGRSGRLRRINGALLDLGVSSMQFDQKERGFSFSDPFQLLDMRMDRSQTLTAKEVLNSYPEEKLIKIFFDYGEERHAKKIVKEICRRRKINKLSTVGDLISCLKKTIPQKDQYKKIHFATKTFQALRIEVNQELDYLEKTLKDFVLLLKSKSKLAVISFHSLEDRIVKNTFKFLESDCVCPPRAPICTCKKNT